MDGAQVAQYAAAAGFQGQALQIAVAIANGESGFQESVHGDTGITDGTWGDSIGLWQIRSLRAETGTGGWRDASRLEDPAFNAQAAFQISGGGENFSPWSVYTNSTYLSYMGDAAGYVGSVGSGVATSPQDAEAAQKVSSVVGFAQAQLGKPYEYGGSGPDTWDCSGLTQAAFATIGVSLPHDAAAQATMGQGIDQSKAAAGDLANHFGDGVENGHCGILISHDEWIVAPYTGQNVQVNPVPWEKITAVRRFVTGGSESFWSKLIGTSGLDVLGLGGLDIDNPLNALKVLTQAGSWIANKHNIVRVLEVVGGVIACVIGVQMVAKIMGGEGTVSALTSSAKSTTGINKLNEFKRSTRAAAKTAVTKGAA